MERKRKTSKLLNKTNLCYTFYFFLLSIFTTSASTISCLDTKCTIFFKSDIDFQKNKVEIGQGMMSQEKSKNSIDWPRRFLGGPGSFPPRCNGKCGKCTPCRPVHVPVPPGTPVTAEYYPEAWRCKCGNKLYMP
ncbi:EPIDERMAL PATTERNING FACTOR-like protein 5 [Vicia villosa]|uniref:EPIDERMAL PATTERNING FACTOR-like protein 5 n=1 Tax=Vicia villosa TaxID=3911 RepID=UPI00273AC4A8|nr:EPIDERMAL PATTERNING FACTOR-like protein 5 [Vicia villosa]